MEASAAAFSEDSGPDVRPSSGRAAQGRGRRSRLARVRGDLPFDLTTTIDRCLEPDPHLRPNVHELGTQISEALPWLADDLPEPGFGARFGRIFGRRQGSAAAPHEPAPRALRESHEPGSGRVWRFGLAALVGITVRFEAVDDPRYAALCEAVAGGRLDEAFALLPNVDRERASMDPRLAPLRADPRWRRP